MRLQKRQVILLVDNAPVHIVQISLTNVCVEFLPPNTTAFLQPCDAGIINSFKCQYKKRFIQNRIKAFDIVQGIFQFLYFIIPVLTFFLLGTDQAPANFNILHTIHMAANA